MSEELAILVPALRRPQNVAPLLNSALRAAPGARVLFICDPDDEPEILAIKDEGGEHIAPGGNYAAKINAGVRHTDEPLIFMGADDLRFHPGWLEAATAWLRGKTEVVGTNDLCNPRVMAGNHSTHSLLTREYAERGTIDEKGKVLHEGYVHEYVDDEFVQTAIRRSAFSFAEDSIVEHMHPNAGKAEMDDLYAGRGLRMKMGRKVYRRRRRLWT